MNPEQVCFYTVKSIRRTLSSFCIKANFCINLKLVLRERETVLSVWTAGLRPSIYTVLSCYKNPVIKIIYIILRAGGQRSTRTRPCILYRTNTMSIPFLTERTFREAEMGEVHFGEVRIQKGGKTKKSKKSKSKKTKSKKYKKLKRW